MDFYEQNAELALNLVRQYGTTVTLIRYKHVTDDVAGTVASEVDLTGPAAALNLPASAGTIQAFDNRALNAALGTANIRYFLMAAKGAPFEPRPQDIILYADREWQILGSTPLNPAGVPLLYKIGSLGV